MKGWESDDDGGDVMGLSYDGDDDGKIHLDCGDGGGGMGLDYGDDGGGEKGLMNGDDDDDETD